MLIAHGDRRTYRRGCRCLPCRAANAAYERCRRAGDLLPDPAEMVDAVFAEMHLTALRGQGVGYRQAARLAGLCDRLVSDIRSGRRTRIRADTQTRILGVRPVLAHGQSITGWRSWRLIDSLKREEFTQGAIAQMLGNRHPSLQLGKKRMRVRSALRVRAVWNRQVNDEEAPEGRHDRRR